MARVWISVIRLAFQSHLSSREQSIRSIRRTAAEKLYLDVGYRGSDRLPQALGALLGFLQIRQVQP